MMLLIVNDVINCEWSLDHYPLTVPWGCLVTEQLKCWAACPEAPGSSYPAVSTPNVPGAPEGERNIPVA